LHPWEKNHLSQGKRRKKKNRKTSLNSCAGTFQEGREGVGGLFRDSNQQSHVRDEGPLSLKLKFSKEKCRYAELKS